MRRLAIGVVVAASGLVLSGFSPAQATSRLACDLLTDAPGDTTQGPPQKPVPTSEPGLDVVSADVSVSKAWVTTAVRVKKLALGGSQAPDMWRWAMMFTAGDVTYALTVRTGIGDVYGEATVVHMLDADTATWSESGIGNAAKVRVTLDEQRSEIRATIARSALTGSGGVGIGQRLSGLRAYTFHEHTAYVDGVFNYPGGEYDIADMAKSSKTYLAGARSCVKPGS